MSEEKLPSDDAASLLALTDASRLQFFMSHEGNRMYMILMGELDLATAPVLTRAFRDVSAEHDGDVILDIGLVTFLNSTGLSLFVVQHKDLQACGRKLTIYAPTPMARRLFQITGLTRILRIEP